MAYVPQQPSPGGSGGTGYDPDAYAAPGSGYDAADLGGGSDGTGGRAARRAGGGGGNGG